MTTETTSTTTDTPRIYVASLSDYNAGRLHGRWIDADQDADEIASEISEMLRESPENATCQACGATFADGIWTLPLSGANVSTCRYAPGHLPGNAEEWAIHDYDNFGGLSLSEYENIDRVAELGSLIAEHGPAFAAYAANVGIEYATADGFLESYCGEHDSFKDYAYELADDCCLFDGVPDDSPARTYFDWDYWARDLLLGGDYWTTETPAYGVFVFRSY